MRVSLENPRVSRAEPYMDVDLDARHAPPQEPFFLSLLQKDTVQRNAERQLRRTNGNISGRVQKKTGAPVNMLCTKLVIESQRPNSKKNMAPYFHCIACDKGHASNKQSRAFAHVDECNVFFSAIICLIYVLLTIDFVSTDPSERLGRLICRSEVRPAKRWCREHCEWCCQS